MFTTCGSDSDAANLLSHVHPKPVATKYFLARLALNRDDKDSAHDLYTP